MIRCGPERVTLVCALCILQGSAYHFCNITSLRTHVFPHLLLALIEGAVGAAVLSLTAVGLGLVFGVMRVVNVAHGEFFMLGAPEKPKT